MPDKATLERARRDKRQGKSASTQAGEFVREEIHHIREGEHGARSAKQAIAIGLSKARRAGVDIPENPKSDRPKRRSPARKATTRKSPARARAALNKLKKEPRAAASHLALSRQAHSQARKRSAADRSRAAKKAARTRARASA
jgi:hypothetical protein